MKNKRFIICLFVICILTFGIFNLKPRADSGWDSSYDFGDSWDSGSWDSGSWGDDSYWSSSNYDTNGELSPMAAIIITIIIVIIIIAAFKNKDTSNLSTNNYNAKTNYIDLPDEEIHKYGISKDEFKKMVFEKYVEIQEDWTNFNYDGLKNNLTDELYNTYMMQLDALKIKNQKNIMSDFDNYGCKIVEIKEENALLNIIVYLRVQMYDYVVDQDNKVVRGNKNRKIDIEYLITFIKTRNAVNQDTYCPNCGAKVDLVASGKCEYCGSIIVVNAKDYVMSKKTCIGQRNK